MKRILVIDDCRNFPPSDEDEITTVRTAEEAIEWLTKNTQQLDEIWLDFDLGKVFGRLELVDTAMPVVQYLAECSFYGTPYPVNKIFLHTSNPVGKEAMKLVLDRYGYDVTPVEAHFGI